MDTSRLNGNRYSAKQSTQAVDLCWDPLTVKFSSVYSVVSSAKLLSVSHDRTSSTDFAKIATTACCLKVGSQDRLQSTPQSRTTSAIETDLCSSNGIIINDALFLVNYWSRNPRDLCFFRWCVTPPSSRCHSRGKSRNILCSLAHFATNFLAILWRGFYAYDDTKFIHSHEANFSIACSDCGRSFRKVAACTV